MAHELTITPSGHLALLELKAADDSVELPNRLVAAFAESASHGLLHLATHALQTRLPPGLEYVRSFARTYLTRLCQTPTLEASKEVPPTAVPAPAELSAWIVQAPPIAGLEYLREESLAAWWSDLDALVRDEIRHLSATRILPGDLSGASLFTWPRTSAIQPIHSRFWRRMQADYRPRARCNTKLWGGRCRTMPAPRIARPCLPCWFPCSGRRSAALS
jgi:hypothetical protein